MTFRLFKSHVCICIPRGCSVELPRSGPKRSLYISPACNERDPLMIYPRII